MHFVGIDFQSHPFWDKYVEFEDRNNDKIRKIKIYRRAYQLPNFHYNKYYEKFRAFLMNSEQSLEEIVEEDVLKAITAAVDRENEGLSRAPLDYDRQIRIKLDEYYYNILMKLQAGLQTRWTFENNIKRGYFHVTDLEDAELDNWRKYLDYEEKEGDFNSTCFLYERCLVPCALYEEFWLRYARWLFSQGKEEDCRLVYVRASCIFVPISQTTIRLNWARFEEKLGCINKARDIHMAILEQVPDHVETIISLAGVDRRHKGNDAAVRTLDDYINGVDRRHEDDDPSTQALDAYITKRSAQVGGVLAAEQARILWKCKGAIDEARQVFKDKHERFLDSKQFWLKYLEFEASQTSSDEDEAHTRVKAVHDLMRAKGRFPADTAKELSHYYMEYLLDFAGKDAANEFMLLDREINGYVSSKNISLPPAGHSKPHSTAKKRKHKNKSAAAAGSI